MAQAKRKTATKTKKQMPSRGRQVAVRTQKKSSNAQVGSNVFFVAGMSFLAATLLFADLMLMMS